MKLNKPKFWDYKKLNFLGILLLPLTFPIIINNFILKIRTKKKSSKIKSICVGNIYIGGTGKTPLTIELYKIFHKLNCKRGFDCSTNINISYTNRFYFRRFFFSSDF